MASMWYVLRSKPGKEGFLTRQLETRQVEVFYPWLRAYPVNPRARKIKPYFPGYLFVHLDLQQPLPVHLEHLPGAVNLVNFGGEIAHVPDAIITAIRNKVDQANLERTNQLTGFKPGDPVRIYTGLFEGYEGILDTTLAGSERVTVLLKLLQNTNMRVELPSGYLEKKKTGTLRRRS